MTSFEERVGDERVLAIVRTRDAEAPPAIVAALAAAGLRLAEVSLSTAAGRDALPEAVAAGGPETLVGAGTVLTPRDAEMAVGRGARFLVAPSFDAAVDAWARDAGVPYLPGVMTPTEVAVAMAHGRELLKLFPAGALGPGYVRDLLGPYPDVRLVATGGVDADNAAAFMSAGAVAVAVGGALTGGDVRDRASQLRDLVLAEG